jgi:Nif-specific regulatory protein
MRLIGLKGPRIGESIALDADEISVGRESTNTIPLSDASVSRRHCVLRKEDGGFVLSDLDSFNGTFVNRLPVKQRTLQHQDQITIGDSLFLFVGEEEAEGDLSHMVEQRPTLWDTIELRREDSLYLQPEKAIAAAQAHHQISLHLKAVLQFATDANRVKTMRDLRSHLFDAIAETIPADHAVLLLREGSGGEFKSHGWDRDAGQSSKVLVSRTVVEQVLSRKTAILSPDVRSDESLSDAKSILVLQVRSLVCAPLILEEKNLGLLYADSTNAETRLQEDHLHLTIAFADIAAAAVDRILRAEWMAGENRRLVEALQSERMVGESAAMQDVYRLVARVAPADSTVLITGESGTGKELVAQAIHRGSARSDRPLVSINCAALAETLLESELFGHEKGAFTGAIMQKKGKLEVADGGTLFLDEVAEMSPALQAKLLRVIQERQFERVGGTKTMTVDVRFIGATNKDLKEAIKNNTFRQDLYYRLNVVGIHLPPLRERRDDIVLLASYFVAKYSEKLKRNIRGLSPETRSVLIGYDWPGNVRELENAIERAVVMCTSDTILPEDLPESMMEQHEPAPGLALSKFHDVLTQTKKDLIQQAVKQTGGNYKEAAKLLGLHPNYLHRLIRNLGIKSFLTQSTQREEGEIKDNR